ncbi:alpha-hydroxy acid oxidase [Salipiger abyssi]|uniref:Glycolate oxidase n=1 Tax=Salipiger abyssi TaxID=1250539 RepID=A0A1P8UMS8_9RHOB|nr:alpha-hydroxy acid oxidase [Salipiger abyssi]APZ50668.1 glycolate oxidase [Salipiger abyssi]
MADTSDWPTLAALSQAARDRLPQAHWDYLMGGAESETTLRRNAADFERIALMPGALRDVRQVDLSTTVMGRKLALPIFPTAIGSLDLLHPEGATASARAAVAAGTTACTGILSKPSFEAVAAEAGGPLLFQLYIRGDEAWLADTLKRAEAAGFFGIALTVDSPVYGRRERDIANGFSSRRAPDRAALPNTPDATRAAYQAAVSWEILPKLREMTRLPIALKGIMSVEDALRGVELGADAIYVSNHGGRQLDHAPSALAQLGRIAAAVNGRAEILFDSGVTRGSDVVKALALGASAVGLGKLQGLALAAGGEAGVRQLLALLAQEIAATMALVGATRLSELTPACLTSSDVPILP